MSARTVTIAFEGPDVEEGTVSLDDLVKVLAHLQSAVRHMVDELGGRQATRGPLPDNVKRAGTLVLTGTGHGSFIADVALAEQPEAPLVDFAEEALDKVILYAREPAHAPGRVASDLAMLQEGLSAGVVAVNLHGGRSNASARLQRRERIQAEQGRVSVESIKVVGRLLEVDWKDHTAELHRPDRMFRLSFKPAQGIEFERLANHYVLVTGLAEQTAELHVTRVLVTDLEPSGSGDDFWRSQSFDELVAEQRVKPFEFPSDQDLKRTAESADEFLAAIFAHEYEPASES